MDFMKKTLLVNLSLLPIFAQFDVQAAAMQISKQQTIGEEVNYAIKDMFLKLDEDSQYAIESPQNNNEVVGNTLKYAHGAISGNKEKQLEAEKKIKETEDKARKAMESLKDILKNHRSELKNSPYAYFLNKNSIDTTYPDIVTRFKEKQTEIKDKVLNNQSISNQIKSAAINKIAQWTLFWPRLLNELSAAYEGKGFTSHSAIFYLNKEDEWLNWYQQKEGACSSYKSTTPDPLNLPLSKKEDKTLHTAPGLNVSTTDTITSHKPSTPVAHHAQSTSQPQPVAKQNATVKTPAPQIGRSQSSGPVRVVSVAKVPVTRRPISAPQIKATVKPGSTSVVNQVKKSMPNQLQTQARLQSVATKTSSPSKTIIQKTPSPVQKPTPKNVTQQNITLKTPTQQISRAQSPATARVVSVAKVPISRRPIISAPQIKATVKPGSTSVVNQVKKQLPNQLQTQARSQSVATKPIIQKSPSPSRLPIVQKPTTFRSVGLNKAKVTPKLSSR